MSEPLVLELQSRGHGVSVLTGFPNYPQGTVYEGYNQQLYKIQCLNGVRVSRVPLYPDHSRSHARRTLSYASFALTASTMGVWKCQRPDIVWAYLPPLSAAIPATLIARKYGVPLVLDVKDLWPEELVSAGVSPSSIAYKVIDRVASYVYEQASAVTVPTHGFRESLISRGLAPDKVVLLPNWVDVDMHRQGIDTTTERKYGLKGKFNIVYAGNIGQPQGLETLLRAAYLCQGYSEVQFVIVGDGTELESLQSATGQMGLRNVVFTGRLDTNAVADIFAFASALLVHLRRAPVFSISVPSKIIAYLSAGKPIIAAIEGEAGELITQCKAGLVCAPENPKALANAVIRLFALDDDERRFMGTNARSVYLQGHTKAMAVERYEALFTRLAQSRAI